MGKGRTSQKTTYKFILALDKAAPFLAERRLKRIMKVKFSADIYNLKDELTQIKEKYEDKYNMKN